MDFEELKKLYLQKKKKYGEKVFSKISELFQEAKANHKQFFLNSKVAKDALREGRTPDHEQSWRAFKGKNLEKLVIFMIEEEVKTLGLNIVEGNKLEKTNSMNLSKELAQVKKNLLVDYGEFGFHLPDVDIIIYNPKDCKIIAVISSKVTLRERIAQTGYWKIKLSQDKTTKHIKVFFITPDEDETLVKKKPAKKGRAIVELDTDGSYVLSEVKVEESNKVKMFDRFIDDLKKLINDLK